MPDMQLHRAAFVLAGLAAVATPAYADVTVFTGSVTSPSNRQTTGVAAGVTLIVVGFEFEYATVNQDLAAGAPGLRTGMANAFLQPPMNIMGIRPYVTSGVGLYQERAGAQTTTHVAFNSGGGAKVSLIGPLRARVDYRVFKLRGTPQTSLVHRIYIGANLSF